MSEPLSNAAVLLPVYDLTKGALVPEPPADVERILSMLAEAGMEEARASARAAAAQRIHEECEARARQARLVEEHLGKALLRVVAATSRALLREPA